MLFRSTFARNSSDGVHVSPLNALTHAIQAGEQQVLASDRFDAIIRTGLPASRIQWHTRHPTRASERGYVWRYRLMQAATVLVLDLYR